MKTLLQITQDENTGHIHVDSDVFFVAVKENDPFPLKTLDYREDPDPLDSEDFTDIPDSQDAEDYPELPDWGQLNTSYRQPQGYRRPYQIRSYSSSDDLHPALSRKLREWRNVKSEELGLSPHVILRNNVLKEIANKLPANERELLDVFGFGKASLERYGADILALVQRYVATRPEDDWADEDRDTETVF